VSARRTTGGSARTSASAIERSESGSSQAWVRGQALANGDLPEQVCDHPQVAEMVDPWVRRWGSVATPLLWSHAMYLLAEAAAL